MATERAAIPWGERRMGSGARATSTGDAGYRRPVRRRPWRRLTPGGVTGLGVVLALVAVALVGPVLVADPDRQDLLGRLAPPVWLGGDWAHPLGTDALGRDLLARLVVGARVSLLVGVVATVLAGAVGVALGVAAGYGGGSVDRVVAFVADVQLAVPFVVVAIAVVAVREPGLLTVVAVLVATGWVGYARVARLQATALRRAPYVEAARALGAGSGRIAVRHVLPNLLGPMIVLGSQQVAAMILYEAALSYLGLGVPPDVVTWGGMVADGQDALPTAWWVSVLPGGAIALAVLGLNLFGDWLADVGRWRG